MNRNFISQKNRILSKNKISARWNLVLNNITKCTNRNVLTYHAESDSALLDTKKRTKKETCPKNNISHQFHANSVNTIISMQTKHETLLVISIIDSFCETFISSEHFQVI